MARVVPVGPIDPELYAFAKKEAEKAERNPRYVPKNCPADRGQIIYKRIGNAVKALVISADEYIGNYSHNARSSIPIFFDLGSAVEDLENLTSFDSSGDFSVNTPLYSVSQTTGSVNFIGGGREIHVYSRDTRSREMIAFNSDNYWYQDIKTKISTVTTVEFFGAAFDEDGIYRLDKLNEFQTSQDSVFEDHTFVSGWLNAYDPPKYHTRTNRLEDVVGVATRGTDYFLVVKRSIEDVYKGDRTVTGTYYIKSGVEFDVIVNGTVSTTFKGPSSFNAGTYGPFGGGPAEYTTDGGDWHLTAPYPSTKWFHLVPRSDSGGLGYIFGGVREIKSPTEVFAGHSYRTIANKYGVFVVDYGTPSARRPSVVWIKPLHIKMDDQDDQDASLEVMRLLCDEDDAEQNEYATNSEVLTITPFGSEFYGSTTAMPSGSAHLFLISKKKSPNSVILMSASAGFYVDLSGVVEGYASGQITRTELEGWKIEEITELPKFPGEYPQWHPPSLMPIPLLSKKERKIANEAKKASEKASEGA